MKIYVAAFAGFVVLAIPFVAWHLTHPGQYAQQIRMYALYDSRALDAAQGARELAAPASLAERAAVYWDYFNPSFLFFAGDTGLLNGTRYTGVFLLPMLILIPAGILVSVMTGGSARWLLLMLLAASPLAAVVVAERYRINRALLMLPAASIIATVAVEEFGAAADGPDDGPRSCLVVSMPLQFDCVLSRLFRRLPGALVSVVRVQPPRRDGGDHPPRAPATTSGFHKSLQWADYYWPFYLDVFGRRELGPRTHYIDPAQARLADIGVGYVLCRAGEEQRFLDAGFTRVAAILEPDQVHSLSVLKR